MEPLFFKAENRWDKEWRPTGWLAASMEPLFFKAENLLQAITQIVAAFRFNGAAFFQSGKYTGCPSVVPTVKGLQWSRFFSKRKMPSSSS